MVDRRASLQNYAIYRDSAAWLDYDRITNQNLLYRDFHFPAISDNQRSFRLQFDQLTDRIRSPTLGQSFQHPPQQNEHDKQPRHFIVDVIFTVVGIATPDKNGRGYTVKKGGAGAQSDKGIHTGTAILHHRSDTYSVELVACGDNRGGKQQLKQSHVAIGEGGEWQTHVMAHSKVKQGNAES